MPRQLRLAPVAAAIALALAGCGSSDSGNSTGTVDSAAAKHLVAEADPICKQIAVKREAANASLHGTSKSTLEKLAQLAPKVSVTEHQAVARLRTLTPPSALADDWRQILTGIEKLANDTTQIGVDAKADNLSKVEALTASGRTLREHLSTIAARDGFAYCGRTS
jgi:hypothetical protein